MPRTTSLRPLAVFSLCSAVATLGACVEDVPFDEELAAEPDDDAIDPRSPEGFSDRDDGSEPLPIINGVSFDSDRDVMVLNTYLGTCSGTLLRNDIVLTARHCVTATGGVGDDVPVLAPNSFFVIQDGAGDTYDGFVFVTDVVGAPNPSDDWALLKLQGNLPIDGRYGGASTELYPKSTTDFVDSAVLCAGYGAEECTFDQDGKATGPEDPVNYLRAGIASVFDDEPRIELVTFPAVQPGDWLPSKGDSGAGCRYPVFENPNFQRVAGIVSEGFACNGADEPEEWKVYLEPIDDDLTAIKNTIDNLSGDFFDAFSGYPGQYEVVEPSALTGGPSEWLHVSGSWLLQNSLAKGNAANAEGTKYIRSNEVLANGVVRVDTFSLYSGAAGIIFRMRDDTHYYRLSFDEGSQAVAIHRRSGTAWQELGSAPVSFDWWGWHELEVDTWENDFTVRFDGAIVLEASDPAYSFMAGRVGLYTYDHSSYFDNLEIER